MANTLYALTGATASGKTSCALAWAQQNNAEILSCDALLFYRGMDIGTAKPSPEERNGIPHYGIDLVPVHETYDIHRYVHYARKTVEDIIARGKNVLITGGSGFYLKSFFAPVTDGVSIPEKIRQDIQAIDKNEGLKGLCHALHTLNPNGVNGIDLNNPHRVLRALERCLATGKTIQQLRSEFEAMPSAFSDFKLQLCVLTRDDPSMRERIAKRTQTMIETGLIEEVQALVAAGLLNNPTAARSIGYAQTLQWLEAKTDDKTSLAESINTATWQLVRKQRTWFRHQLPQDTRFITPEQAQHVRLFD